MEWTHHLRIIVIGSMDNASKYLDAIYLTMHDFISFWQI